MFFNWSSNKVTLISKTAAIQQANDQPSMAWAILFFCGLLVTMPAGGQEAVTLKVRNDTPNGGGKAAQIRIRSLKSLTPENPWRELNVGPGRVATLEIASPDNYEVVATADGVTYKSVPIPLKEKVVANPDYELKLGRIFAAPPGAPPRAKLGLGFGPPPDQDGRPQLGGEQFEFKPVGPNGSLRDRLKNRIQGGIN